MNIRATVAQVPRPLRWAVTLSLAFLVVVTVVTSLTVSTTKGVVIALQVDGAHETSGPILMLGVQSFDAVLLRAGLDQLAGQDVFVVRETTKEKAPGVRDELRDSLQHVRSIVRDQSSRLDLPVGVVGRSGELAMLLALLDGTGRGTLVAPGTTVAVTGMVERDGSIGVVGGVETKARAAEAAGADLILVPIGSFSDARAGAPHARIVEVGTVGGAVATLCAYGGEDLFCDPWLVQTRLRLTTGSHPDLSALTGPIGALRPR